MFRIPADSGGGEDWGPAQAVAGEPKPGAPGSVQLSEPARDDWQQTTVRDGREHHTPYLIILSVHQPLPIFQVSIISFSNLVSNLQKRHTNVK